MRLHVPSRAGIGVCQISFALFCLSIEFGYHNRKISVCTHIPECFRLGLPRVIPVYSDSIKIERRKAKNPLGFINSGEEARAEQHMLAVVLSDRAANYIEVSVPDKATEELFHFICYIRRFGFVLARNINKPRPRRRIGISVYVHTVNNLKRIDRKVVAKHCSLHGELVISGKSDYGIIANIFFGLRLRSLVREGFKIGVKHRHGVVFGENRRASDRCVYANFRTVSSGETTDSYLSIETAFNPQKFCGTARCNIESKVILKTSCSRNSPLFFSAVFFNCRRFLS